VSVGVGCLGATTPAPTSRRSTAPAKAAPGAAPTAVALPAGASYVLETRDHLFDAGAAIDRARAEGRDPRLVLFGSPVEDLNQRVGLVLRELLEREAARRHEPKDPVLIFGLPRGSGVAVDGQGGFIRDADLAVVEAAVATLRSRGLDARFDRSSSLGLGVRDLGTRPCARVLVDLDRLRLARSVGAIEAATTARLTVRGADGRDRRAPIVSLSAHVDRAPFDALAGLGEALALAALRALSDAASTESGWGPAGWAGGLLDSSPSARPASPQAGGSGAGKTGEDRGRSGKKPAPPVWWEPLPRPWSQHAPVAFDQRTLVLEVPPLPVATPLRLAEQGDAHALSPRSPLGEAIAAALALARVGRTSGAAPVSSSLSVSVSAEFWEVPTGKGPPVTSVNLIYQIGAGRERWAEGSVHGSSLDPAVAATRAIRRLLAACGQELRRRDTAGLDATPSVFVLERVAHTRDFLETVFVESSSGRLLRREVLPLGDAAHGPPGQWLLSERTAEGLLLSPTAYSQLAARLAPSVALGPVGDGFHVGYFGRYLDESPRTEPSPVSEPVPSPETSTPPRR
jgi:hypothetical protein